MRLLLDTHIWLWLLENPSQLAPEVLAQIEHADERLLSAASVWEIAIKANLGKLGASGGAEAIYREILEEIGASVLLISAEQALIAARLPDVHRDPFDRMLVAQAQATGATLVTADDKVRAYGGDVLWAKA